MSNAGRWRTLRFIGIGLLIIAAASCVSSGSLSGQIKDACNTTHKTFLALT